MSLPNGNPLVIFLESIKGKSRTGVGLAILLSVALAMVWANSPYGDLYRSLIHTELKLGIGTAEISEPVTVWVNDGLMAVFFLFVGLELKREILGGKLSSFKLAILPVGAAMGGMLVPAAIYAFFNWGGVGQNGWGIPMATDIAFALGLLSVFGKRVPVELKVFLVALAIVDDLGAVLVIAFFYTSGISGIDLLHALLFFLLLLGGNFVGIRKAWFYGLVGIGGVWLAFFFSGVHPTIAGILTAFTIPGRVKINEADYLKNLNILHRDFLVTKPIPGSFISERQLEILEEIKTISTDAETPLQKIEYGLSPLVGFFILPLFAFVNAGIHIHGDLVQILTHPIGLGIGFGLILGKFTGIAGASWLMVRLKWATLHSNLRWTHICAVSLVAAIGFTMSFFVTELAFSNDEYAYYAKLSVLFTSVAAGLLGSVWLYRITRSTGQSAS